MKQIIIVLAALAALAAQQPPDESNVPENEKRIPAGHYCKKVGVPISPRETHAHACDCKFSCTVDENGNVVEHEDVRCLAFCHKNGRRCTCHVEEPCSGGGGNARMAMDGRVVQMNVR